MQSLLQSFGGLNNRNTLYGRSDDLLKYASQGVGQPIHTLRLQVSYGSTFLTIKSFMVMNWLAGKAPP